LFALTALSASFWLLLPTIFLWGFSSGLSMVLGRTILHNQVAKSHRARAVSVYQLCLCGGTPVGAWLCGAAIEQFGITQAFVGIAVVTMAVAAVAALKSPLWGLVTGVAATTVDIKTS
jgi:predicted MFS family arabinose efflux permease